MKKTILIVDDVVGNIRILAEFLADYHIVTALDGQTAIRLANVDKPPDLILLDIMMPEMSGYEVCKILKLSHITRDIPIIFVSVKDKTEDEKKGFDLGAVDYISKPFNLQIVRARVKNHLELKTHRDNLAELVGAKEREIKKIYKQLLHAEKMSLAGKLSASIAHELGSPVYGIRNFLVSLQQSSVLSGSNEKMAKLAIAECGRIKDMIINLQNFNRLTTGRMEAINLHSIVDDMLMLCLKDLNRKKVKVVREYGPDIPETFLIVDQMKQVVLNLLSNSGEAMAASGGEIKIRTRRKDNVILLMISDTGEGIDPQMMDLIFQPFFTTKPGSQGTGLGLSLSREIIKRHGGTIQVTNNPHGGVTFVVDLPIKEGANG